MESNQPLVSVALITYQNAPYLKESIESILAQTYPHIEVIISDDGSTDGSKKIISEYAERSDRIKVLSAPLNRGISENINAAFDHCVGEYICIIAGDDAMYPRKIEKQVEYLENNRDFELCFHNVDVYDDERGIVLYQWLDRFLPTRFPSDALFLANWYFKKKKRKTPSGSWFGRSSYMKNGINDPRTSSYHEFIFTMGMYAANPTGKWHTLPEVLGKYRIHGGSLSNAKQNWQRRAEEVGICYVLAATRFPQFGRQIKNEMAYWWFLQLLYNQVPDGTYRKYAREFIRNFGMGRYLYMVTCKILLKKTFSMMRKMFR
jgi:glycosyltransferase involved in cell wall biosynthesis